MGLRRERLSSEQTRERLIDAGIEALHQSGMSIGLDAVNLEQAVRDAEVSRSSAYAVWSNEEYSPQEEFQRSVLIRAVSGQKSTLVELTETVATLFVELDGTMSRREVVREIIRQSANQNVKATSDSISWKLAIAIRAVLHSRPEEERDQELCQWMEETQVALREFTIASIYKPLAATMQIEPRPQYGERAYELGEVCVSAVSEGFSMRYWLESHQYLEGLEHPGVVGGEANWSMFALLFEQIVEMFFVPISGSWDDLT